MPAVRSFVAPSGLALAEQLQLLRQPSPHYIAARGVEPRHTGQSFEIPAKTYSKEGRCWVVSLTPEQGGPGFLALSERCTHLGVALPWLEDFAFTNPSDGKAKKGWFRCPAHGATFDDVGMRVFGPASRPLDRVDLRYNGADGLYLYPARIAQGSSENAAWAVKV